MNLVFAAGISGSIAEPSGRFVARRGSSADCLARVAVWQERAVVARVLHGARPRSSAGRRELTGTSSRSTVASKESTDSLRESTVALRESSDARTEVIDARTEVIVVRTEVIVVRTEVIVA